MKLPHPTIEPARHPLPSDLVHDLRTPLNQIIGYSEMLGDRAREVGQAENAADLEKVRSAGHRLLEIITENFEPGANRGGAAQAVVQALSSKELPRQIPKLEAKLSDKAGLILVVDDEEGNRDILSRRLEMEGYGVATAENGRQALEMLRSEIYDLVLLDIMMPEIDGYEVLRCLKDDVRLRHVPVIMISALSEMESVARCIEMGAEDYLPKPFNPTLLKARIGASLEKKRAHDREMTLFNQLDENYKRLQNLEKLRDDLTHMIVHDLRTPLVSMMLAVQTLSVVGEVNEGQREVVDIAINGGGALLAMINTLLDVEKFESGAMELDYSLVSLPEVIAGAVNLILPLANVKHISVVQDIPAELPWLEADENKLQRVLANLLGNAVKFTPDGGSVTLRVRQNDQQALEISVVDTGGGIPPEAYGRIFEKFGQVESRGRGNTMSTGLGLTFCKLAVEAHGGHIGVESSLAGSRFFFTIPISEPKS